MRDTLTRDHIAVPAMWRLSMLVHADSVEVVMNSSLEDHALIYRHLQLNPAMSQLAAFEDLIYENPLLLSDFGKVDILIDTPKYTIVPTEIESDEVREAVVRQLWPDDTLAVVANQLPQCGETLLMCVDQGLLSFVRRTFLDSKPMHPVAALAAYFSPISHQGNSGKIYVNLRNDSIDIVAFAGYTLRIACTYDTPTIDDAVYYILAAAQDAKFSLVDDEIHLCGEQKVREAIAPKLREFATYVMPVIFPSQIFRGGKEALDAPFPLIILPLCE